MYGYGYCKKHERPYEIRRIPGDWVFECPDCRAEGAYDTVATTTTKMLPAEEWTASNRTKKSADHQPGAR